MKNKSHKKTRPDQVNSTLQNSFQDQGQIKTDQAQLNKTQLNETQLNWQKTEPNSIKLKSNKIIETHLN